MARKGVRLDALLVERGLFPTRAKAKAAIMAGVVYVDGQRAGKAGSAVSPDAQLEVRGPANPYVSRGGLKLEHALDRFGVLVAGRTCIDVGASTGGFTDCLLQRGAARVYAVDVGYGQLDWKLRQDPRVVVVERTNFRHVQPGDLPRADLIVIDVSFISLIKILPAAQGTLKDDGDVVALIKPQFEAGRRAVGKGGVVRDAGVHREVIQNLLAGAGALGWRPIALTYSPVLGPKGNIEFFVWWKRNPQGETTSSVDAETVSQVVAQAHEALL